MQIIIQQVGLMFVFILTGYILGIKKILDSSQTQILSVILIYVIVPFNNFKAFCTNCTPVYLKGHFILIIAGIAFVAVTVAAAKPLSRRMGKDAYDALIYEYGIVVPNMGYMGVPLVMGLYGEVGQINYMMFVLALNFITYVYYLPLMTKKKGLSVKSLFNAPIIGIVLGMIIGLSGLHVPPFVTQVCSAAGSSLGPISMIMTGITISQFPFRSMLNNRNVYIAVILRMVFLPLVIIFGLGAFLPAEIIKMAVLVYAMPCGLNTIVFPKLVNEDNLTGACLPFISTVISLISLPLLLNLI